MYTASKSRVVSLQVAAYWLVRVLGVRLLPGRTEGWNPPCTADEWGDLLQQWRVSTGNLDGFAVYQRRQHDRSGVTMIVTRSGTAVAVLKLRDDGEPLAKEQHALAALQVALPRTFRAPRPLGYGSVGGWHWSAQEAVFTKPHRPVLSVDPDLFDEVRHALATLVDPDAERRVPAHRDLTPWNLRRDAAGQIWLYDWEDCGLAPEGADRAYFLAAAAALDGGHLPSDLPVDAIAYCQQIVAARRATNAGDAKLAAAMLAALDGAPI